jgi:hypothetical protein
MSVSDCDFACDRVKVQRKPVNGTPESLWADRLWQAAGEPD